MVSDAWLAVLQAFPPGTGATRVLPAIAAAGSADRLCAWPLRELLARGVPAESAHRLKQPDHAVIDQWRRWLERPGCALATLGDPHYPPRLAQLPDPPAALWLRGPDPGVLLCPQLAMVGSRNPTGGGRASAEAFAAELSQRGLTVTSGLAMGIDGASHRGALAGPGGTVAVLGAGIDTVYPRVNESLAASIAADWLIVSEYAPGVPVRKHQFPARNRIIAGLSLGTVVVEATRRSGSLITARLAAEYGREVFALPGSIHSPLSRGCHALIRSGAVLVEGVDQVLAELAPQLAGENILEPDAEMPVSEPAKARAGCAKLLDLLGFEPVGSDELAARAGLTAAELSSMLLLLEMDGAVEALPGARYCRLPNRRPVKRG
jgi:DNA processing protein